MIACKLAGRLSFASWAIWGQISRCRLVGIFQQIREWSSCLNPHAREDLQWWFSMISDAVPRRVLRNQI